MGFQLSFRSHEATSTTNNDFHVPPSRSRYGDRMFSVAGPRLWNSLRPSWRKPVASCLLKDYWKAIYSGLCMKCRHLSVHLICILFLPIYFLVHVLQLFYIISYSIFVYQYTIYFNNYLYLTYLFYYLLLLLFIHILGILFTLTNLIL